MKKVKKKKKEWIQIQIFTYQKIFSSMKKMTARKDLTG